MTDFNNDFAQERVELHLHTKMSDMDGVTSASDLIRRAYAWGHKAVAITDHGNIQAFPEIMNTVEALRSEGKNIKPIYGMEAYFVNDIIGRADFKKLPVFHITILVKNKIGLKNLYKLVSLSHTKYFYRKPIIPLSELQNYREGLIVGSACSEGELFRTMLENKPQEYTEKIAETYDYFEIQPVMNNETLIREGKVSGEDELRTLNKYISNLADKLGKICVATGDVHYKNSEGVIFRAVIQSAMGKKDADEQPALFFHTTKAMLSEFKYLGEKKAYEVVVANTNAIADMVEDNIKPIPNGKFLPRSYGDEQRLRDICETKAREIYGNKLPEMVQKRLDTELHEISVIGLSDFFLPLRKLVKFINDNGYHVCSQGTVGASFAAFLTGLTEINPLSPHYRCPKCCRSEFITDGSYCSGYDLPSKLCPDCKSEMLRDGHNIPLEIFFGSKEERLPCIVFDISDEIRDKAMQYTEEIFGRDNVITAGNVLTVQEKTARIFLRNYCEDRGVHLGSAETERFVFNCTGVKSTTSCHPGGIFIIPREYEVYDFTPVQRINYMGNVAAHFDYSALNKTLIKLDIVEQTVPTLYKRLEELTCIKIADVPTSDLQVYKLFSSTDVIEINNAELGARYGTLGLPGFSTEFEMQMLDTVQPKCFSDLIKVSGLAHGTGAWLNNACELIQNGICTVSEVISTRDDIMIYLIKKGIDSRAAFNISETIGKGKVNDEINSILAAHGVPKWYIESCKKIKHLPPKAHAVGYAMAAAKLAWFKLYKPAEFYAAAISSHIYIEFETILNGKEAVKQRLTELSGKADITLKERDTAEALQLVYEMMLRGITVIPMTDKSSNKAACIITAARCPPPL